MTAIKDVHWVGCVGADLDCGDRAGNKALFDEVAADAEAWNATVGIELSYERLDDRRACRIATYRELNLQAADLAPTTAWAADAVVAMFDALNAPLRLRAPELRSAVLTPP